MEKCALCGVEQDEVCLPDDAEFHKMNCIADAMADAPDGTKPKPKEAPYNPWARRVDEIKDAALKPNPWKRDGDVESQSFEGVTLTRAARPDRYDLSHEEARTYYIAILRSGESAGGVVPHGPR
jgi:hypothetical protein